MIKTRSYLTAALAAAMLLAGAGVASAVTAGSQVYQGIVRHISADNIKVYNPHTKQTQGFVLLPRFGNVFKADGRTPAQMKDVAAGDYVKVYYDQKFLGAFHADRILILNNGNHVESMNHG